MSRKRTKGRRVTSKSEVISRTATHFFIKASSRAIPVRQLVLDLPPGVNEPPADLTPFHHLMRELPMDSAPGIYVTYRVLEELDSEMNALFQSVSTTFHEQGRHDIADAVSSCNHKLHAVLHHRKTLGKRILLEEEWYAKEYSGNGGLIREDALLIYETEAFLFQATSNLDVIIKMLALLIPTLPLDAFRSRRGPPYIAGGRAIDKLREIGEGYLADLFESNRLNWIQDMIPWRDAITHESRLKEFFCFIPESYLGGGQIAIRYPTMPPTDSSQFFGERVDVYCDNIYTKLCQLYRSVLEHIVRTTVRNNRVYLDLTF